MKHRAQMGAEVFVETNDFLRVVAVAFFLQFGLEIFHFFLLLLAISVVVGGFQVPSLHPPSQRRTLVVFRIVTQIVVIFEEFFQPGSKKAATSVK